MIRRCFWLFFFVSACFIFAGGYTSQAADNLVQNADFEDGDVAPWTMWVEDNAAAATMTLDDTEKLTGDHSMLIDINTAGSGKRVELHQNPFSLKNGQKLTYAFWARVPEGEERSARMITNQRAAPWTSYGSTEITITGEWTEFWTPVDMTVDSDNVGIYVELRDTTGLVWFDRFRLYEGDYVAEDLEETLEPAAVRPHSKLTSTWASVKAAQ